MVDSGGGHDDDGELCKLIKYKLQFCCKVVIRIRPNHDRERDILRFVVRDTRGE